MPADGSPPGVAPERGRIRVGCSSWTSEAWWGRVYPERLTDGERLGFYSRRWDTVEVDSSYYRAPAPSLVRRWASVTPDGFLFALKAPRDQLDPKQPFDPEPLGRFVADAELLGPKLGAILFQFPPWVKPGRATGFVDELLESLPTGPRYAIELRDAGWFRGAEFERLTTRLHDRNVALAWSYLTYVEVPAELTADFVYLRFIGDHDTIPEAQHGEIRVDRSAEIARWAERTQRAIAASAQLAFVYFNNHFAGFAPESVNAFRRALGLDPVRFGPRTL